MSNEVCVKIFYNDTAFYADLESSCLFVSFHRKKYLGRAAANNNIADRPL
jgi:hypothetical protein